MMQLETAAAGAGRMLRFAPEPRQKSAGRRAWTATAMMVAGTLAVALTSYSLSLKVSAERAEAAKLARQNAATETRLKTLEAELRVRMRLPQLQRWNDEVLALKPITAEQYLGNPLHLAAYGTEQLAAPVEGPAMLRPALRTLVQPEAPPRAAGGLKLASVEAPAPRPVAAQRPVAAAAPLDPQLVAAIEALAARETAETRDTAAAQPADLLLQVELPASITGGN